MSPSDSLASLVNEGLIARTDGESLRKAYLFTRTLIDRLRMVRRNATDLVRSPLDSEEVIFLAHRVGLCRRRLVREGKASTEHIEQHVK